MGGPVSRTGAAADVAEFAAAALAAECIRVSQRDEQRVFAVNFGDVAVADIAAIQWQKSAGTDDAGVGNEHHAAAIADAKRRAETFAVGGSAFSALGKNPAEMVTFRGFNPKRGFTDHVRHFLKHPFEVVGIWQIGGTRAASRDEDEHAPHRWFPLEHQFAEGRKLRQVAAGESGVDLDREAGGFRHFHRLDRPVKRPADAAEFVVRLTGRAIETQRKPLDPRGTDGIEI